MTRLLFLCLILVISSFYIGSSYCQATAGIPLHDDEDRSLRHTYQYATIARWAEQEGKRLGNPSVDSAFLRGSLQDRFAPSMAQKKPLTHTDTEERSEIVDATNSLGCTTCHIAMEAVMTAVKHNETIDAIEAILKKICFGSQVCDSLIEKFTKFLPYIVILAEEQDYNAKDMCSMLSFCEVNCCKTKTIPEQVHLGLNEFNRPSVTWTTYERECSEVQLQGNIVNPNNGELMSVYEHTIKGFERTYTNGGWRGWMHHVLDLGPSTLIHKTAEGEVIRHRYRVGCSASNTWSNWFDMRSGVKSKNIAVVGDIGVENSDQNLNRFIEHIEDIDLFVLLGDQSYSDGNQRKWDEFFRKFEVVFSRRPLVTITGNHEVGIIGLPFLNISGYDYRMLLPGLDMTKVPVEEGAAWYYSFNFGPIHFVGMDCEATLDLPLITDEQIRWVIKDLEKVNRTETPFVVVKSHRPFYCSGDNGACDPVQMGYMLGRMEQIFAKYRVDLVLSGHRHNMERCGPVLNYENTTQDKAPIYIVSGAGGNRENFQGFGRDERPYSHFRLTREIGYGILSWDDNASELLWRQFTAEKDTLVDSVTINRKKF